MSSVLSVYFYWKLSIGCFRERVRVGVGRKICVYKISSFRVWRIPVVLNTGSKRLGRCVHLRLRLYVIAHATIINFFALSPFDFKLV